MVLADSVLPESEVTMRNWWKRLWATIRLGIYDVLIGAARRLRTIQLDEALALANSKQGYEYFGNLILGMRRQGDSHLYTLYQCRNKKFHTTSISVDDFIHGTALLPTAAKPFPLGRFTVSKREFTEGIEFIGTLETEESFEKTEADIVVDDLLKEKE